MATLTRRQVIAAIQAQLQQITVANGYHTNCGQQVLYAIDLDIDWQKDCVVFQLGEKGGELKSSGTLHETVLHLEISAYLWGREPFEALADMFEDLSKNLGSNRSFGLEGLNMQLLGFEEYTESEGDQVARTVLQIDVSYKTKLWQRE